MTDNYTYIIVALLPLTSLMLVCQTNPYQALVVRAILGAVAALVYAVLGGADVALTEALVGTMLAVTLYVIAVRSSLVMRLGVVAEEKSATDGNNRFSDELEDIKKAIARHYLRLEVIKYPDSSELERALAEREIHASCSEVNSSEAIADNVPAFTTKVRVRRLWEIMQAETLAQNTVTYLNDTPQEDKH